MVVSAQQENNMSHFANIVITLGLLATFLVALGLVCGLAYLIGYSFENGRQERLNEMEEDDKDIEDSEEEGT